MIGRKGLVEQLLRLKALLALALVVVVFTILSPEFLTTGNLTILLKQVSINAILAVGMTLVILTAGIDLSVGSIAGFTGMVAGYLLTKGLVLAPLGVAVFFPAWLVVVIALAAGALFGVLNGVLVSMLRVPPFIATLGVLNIARGCALLMSGGATFPDLQGAPDLRNQGFSVLGGNGVLGLPAPIWIMVIVAIVAIFIIGRTRLGRYIYAVGGNERAARLAGVRVGQIKFFVYVASALCAAVVGLIIASQLNSSHPATGETFELNAIAAVVLGGTSLMGGRGTIAGTLIGAMVIGVLANGLVLLGVSEFWQILIKGAVIVAAVVVDQYNKTSSREA
jgi:erythritol transport system permease protein